LCTCLEAIKIGVELIVWIGNVGLQAHRQLIVTLATNVNQVQYIQPHTIYAWQTTHTLGYSDCGLTVLEKTLSVRQRYLEFDTSAKINQSIINVVVPYLQQ